MTPTATSAVKGVTGNVTSGVLIAACLSYGTPIFITPTVSLSVFTRPSAERGLSQLHLFNGHVVRPTRKRLTDRLINGKHVRRPSGVITILRSFFTSRAQLRGGGVMVATNPACRGVSPIHFVNGCSSKGVKFTLTRTYTRRKTRIALVTKPISLAMIRPGVGQVSIRSTRRVCRTTVATFPRTSTNVLYTTITSCHPSRRTDRGVGERAGKRVSLHLIPGGSVTTSLKTVGHRGRVLMNFTLRAGGRVTRTRKGVGQGGLSFVILGSLGSTNTNFHYSAGGVAVVSGRNKAVTCPLGDGRRITISVMGGLTALLG